METRGCPVFSSSHLRKSPLLIKGKRPLNALEINNIYNGIEKKLGLATLTMGLSQVAKDENVRKYLDRGKKISQKHVEVLGNFLRDWDLPVPTTSDFEVTASRESPFSDKLILFHSTVVTAYSITTYGKALTNTSEKRVTQAFVRLTTELLDYAKDGVDIMIENSWLERLPETADRKELIH